MFSMQKIGLQMWKPLAPLFASSSKNVFINDDWIEFSHINFDCGDGVIAKKDIICLSQNSNKKNDAATSSSTQDLIVEPALICSISNESRRKLFSDEFHRRRQQQDNDNVSYCSLCCVFIGKTNGGSGENDRSPLDYQQPCNHPVFSSIRCQRCHDMRVLNKDLPQSLDECLLRRQRQQSAELCCPSSNPKGDDEEEDQNNTSSALSDLFALAVNVDEAIFCVTRTVFMLLDEFLYEQQEHQQHSSFSDKIDSFCSCFDEGALPGMNPHSSIVWRRACHLLNQVLSEITTTKEEETIHHSSTTDDNSVSTTIFTVSLQQFFLLRCILQTNQHQAVVLNPKQYLRSKQQKKKDSGDMKEEGCQKNTSPDEENNKDHSNILAPALFLNTSRLNHSCQPNAHVEPCVRMSGAAVRVSVLSVTVEGTSQPVTKIKKGDEIRISYVGYEEEVFRKENREKIHAYLKKNYGFDCDD